MSATLSEDGKHLSCIGQGLSSIPGEWASLYENVESIDLSENSFADVWIEIFGVYFKWRVSELIHHRRSGKSFGNGFKKVTNLVLDGNELTDEPEFPSLPKLHTLWVNNNKIVDLERFLGHVMDRFPRLSYLSLLKNPACPNFFTGKSQDEYKRYRLFVLYRMSNLKFLDASPVTPAEREEAARVGEFCKVVRPDEVAYEKQVAQEDAFEGLNQTLRTGGKGKANFAKSRYVYKGTQSEGNRFIVDDDL